MTQEHASAEWNLYLHGFANFWWHQLGFFTVAIDLKTFDLKLSRQWLYPEFVPNVASVPQSGHQLLFLQLLRGREDGDHIRASSPSPSRVHPQRSPGPQFHTPTGRCIVLSPLPLGCPSDTKSFWDWKCPVLQTNHYSFTVRQLLLSNLTSLPTFILIIK